jgi:hypothetical protein
MLWVVEALVELDDVWVADVFHDMNFSIEQDFLLFVHLLSAIEREVLFDDFDGYHFACFDLSSAYNHGETSSMLRIIY